MKKIITASVLAVLALAMLLPVAGRVNATSLNYPIARQGNPFPPNGGGGHIMFRQGNPFPPNGGGGHITFRQGNPFPPNGGGGHITFRQGNPFPPNGGGGH